MEIVIPGPVNLGHFISTALVLLLLPGPAVLYIIGCSVEQGRLGGLISILGIHTATITNVIAAALGLSAILASSALAFSAVKYAGAAYLIWLGIKRIFGQAESPEIASGLKGVAYSWLFREGFIVNLLNPKTALFFLAFLPQFVDVNRGSVVMQIVFLGLLYTILGFITDGCYAIAAGTAGNWLKSNRAYLRLERYVSGVMFLGLGVAAVLGGNQKSRL